MFDLDVLKSLRDSAEATFSNLVTASKTQTTSLGMSSVSLLDAAASHVLLMVTGIGKTVCIRKASRPEQDNFGSSSSSPAPPNIATANGFSPSLRAVEEVIPLHQKRAGSGAGLSSRRMDVFDSPWSRLVTQGLRLRLLDLLLIPIGHLQRRHGVSRRSLLARMRTPHH